MPRFVFTTALRDEIERAASPIGEAFRLEGFGFVPVIRVAIGAVQIQQDQGTLFELTLLPGKILSDSSGGEWKEGVVTTHFLYKPMQALLLLLPKHFDLVRVLVNRKNKKVNPNSIGNGRAQKIQYFNGDDPFFKQFPLKILVPGKLV